MKHKKDTSVWMIFSGAMAGILIVAAWAQDESRNLETQDDMELSAMIEEEITVSLQIHQEWLEKQDEWEALDAIARRKSLGRFQEHNASLFERQSELLGEVARRFNQRLAGGSESIVVQPLVDSEDGRNHARVLQIISNRFYQVHDTNLSAEERRRLIDDLGEELSAEIDKEQEIYGRIIAKAVEDARATRAPAINPE